MTNNDNIVLLLLQALSDESRLKIIRYLNQNEYTVGSLAETMNLSSPTISHHLSCLRSAGLVTLRADKNQRFYSINKSGLERFKRSVQNIEQIPDEPQIPESDNRWIEALDFSAEDKKVLQEYTYSGIITHLPSKQKKMDVLLRWLSTLFETGRDYSEIEVNAILKAKYAEDYISLRRDLVDMGYLRRQRGGGNYWLSPSENEHSTEG